MNTLSIIFFLIFHLYKYKYNYFIDFIVAFLATLFGVFTAFYLEKKTEEKHNIKEKKVSLLVIWNEYRLINNILKQIKENYSFNELYTTSNPELIYTKYNVLHDISLYIPKNSYHAIVSSKLITQIDNINILNSIYQAYENLSYFQSNMLVINYDFQIKQKYPELFERNQKKLLEEIKKKIEMTKGQLNFAIEKILESDNLIKIELEKYNISCTEEERKIP